jgi:hypothetical protein
LHFHGHPSRNGEHIISQMRSSSLKRFVVQFC